MATTIEEMCRLKYAGAQLSACLRWIAPYLTASIIPGRHGASKLFVVVSTSEPELTLRTFDVQKVANVEVDLEDSG